MSSSESAFAISDDIELHPIAKSRSNSSRDSAEQNSQFSDLGTSLGLDPSRSKLKSFLYRLWNGPIVPRDDPVQFKSAYIQQFESFPQRISAPFPAKIKLPFILLYYTFWLFILQQALAPYLTEQPTWEDEVSGKSLDVISISCRQESSIWRGKNAQCGLNGKKCAPFEDREVYVRCPALCDSESIAYSSISVGDQNIKYRDFTIGGGRLNFPVNGSLSYPYRADSFPCGAAIHAGVVSPYFGGCARIKFVGAQSEFPSRDGSVGFNGFFPASFEFVQLPKCHNCFDPRVLVALINILLGFPVMFLSNSGALAFWTVCISGFWTIILTFDPPMVVKAQDPESLATLISLGFQRLLPLCFILYVFWKIACKTTLSYPSSPICKTLIWYPLFWVGILNNVTFDRLPVDRLTITDILTQPGSIFATLGIVVTIVCGAVVQAYHLWKAGKFREYLRLYVGFIVALVVLGNLAGLNLRIHHYILAMLLLPGTNTKGLTAMLFQGVLLGLLVNGVARWGLASIEETDRSLRRADPTGEIKPPTFIGYEHSNTSISWKVQETNTPTMVNGEFISPHDKLSQFSLLINDIEWYNGPNTSVSLETLAAENKILSQLILSSDSSQDQNLYFRVSRSGGNVRSDYTNAAVLKYPSGQFSFPKPGLTK
ncbi:hypothetical protein OGAPHI_007378 [Ogataea philodendri]|uniref:LCCL domain-containing protein n=1 Tax=Ogataea philodendri TaxID=1378263 RepID=A0A9P8NTP2_9ASCO|nr:uncharacterized protein OGAPHI_007378 [Ogataea philodendri]KAH3660173.1 hypothetical protein OGAPHI_007378 [Ogataea philodendri]